MQFDNLDKYLEFIEKSGEFYPSSFDSIIFKKDDIEFIKSDLISKIGCKCLKCILKYVFQNQRQIFLSYNYYRFIGFFQ
jgi:hypothetical protein